jgi:arsenate reductase
MENIISDRLATLGHPQRLAVFRLLMRRYPDHVPAGDLAGALDLKSSTLSAYLSALMQAGLVVQRRDGTSRRYTIALDAVRETLDFLWLDCCRGRADLCLTPQAAPEAEAEAGAARKYRVLFICTGNSARSIFAEALLRQLAGDRFEAHSAGTKPNATLNPFAVDLLAQKGHEIALLRAKTVAEYQGPEAPAFDFVFTVCDRAANESCPPWPGQPVSAHWGVPDPVKATGSDAEKALAFQQAYGALRNRILAFSELPIGTLDRISLQRAVDDIGRTEMEASA